MSIIGFPELCLTQTLMNLDINNLLVGVNIVVCVALSTLSRNRRWKRSSEQMVSIFLQCLLVYTMENQIMYSPTTNSWSHVNEKSLNQNRRSSIVDRRRWFTSVHLFLLCVSYVLLWGVSSCLFARQIYFSSSRISSKEVTGEEICDFFDVAQLPRKDHFWTSTQQRKRNKDGRSFWKTLYVFISTKSFGRPWRMEAFLKIPRQCCPTQ